MRLLFPKTFLAQIAAIVTSTKAAAVSTDLVSALNERVCWT